MPKGLRILHLSLGERNLTHFGGIFLIHQFFKKLRLKWCLQKQVSFPQRSSYYHPVELILAILYALIAGIPRLSKTKILQGNGAFQQIIGLEKFPYASSLRRFLKRINPQVIQGISKVHDQLRLKMFYLPKPRTSLLFDLDSSVLTLYGKLIEGAEVGYNPQGTQYLIFIHDGPFPAPPFSLFFLLQFSNLPLISFSKPCSVG